MQVQPAGVAWPLSPSNLCYAGRRCCSHATRIALRVRHSLLTGTIKTNLNKKSQRHGINNLCTAQNRSKRTYNICWGVGSSTIWQAKRRADHQADLHNHYVQPNTSQQTRQSADTHTPQQKYIRTNNCHENGYILKIFSCSMRFVATEFIRRKSILRFPYELQVRVRMNIRCIWWSAQICRFWGEKCVAAHCAARSASRLFFVDTHTRFFHTLAKCVCLMSSNLMAVACTRRFSEFSKYCSLFGPVCRHSFSRSKKQKNDRHTISCWGSRGENHKFQLYLISIKIQRIDLFFSWSLFLSLYIYIYIYAIYTSSSAAVHCAKFIT